MSVTDRFITEVSIPDHKYKQALNDLFVESLNDMRGRLREQREQINMAKAQLELAQSESKRMNLVLEALQKRADEASSRLSNETKLLLIEKDRTAHLERELRLLSGHRSDESEQANP